MKSKSIDSWDLASSLACFNALMNMAGKCTQTVDF